MMLIVVPPKCVDLLLRVVERGEPVHVQTLFAEPAVEGFDRRVVYGRWWRWQRQSAGRSGKEPFTGTLNINTASAVDLQSLPGIGAKTAALVVEYRQKNGPSTAEHGDAAAAHPRHSRTRPDSYSSFQKRFEVAQIDRTWCSRPVVPSFGSVAAAMRPRQNRFRAAPWTLVPAPSDQ